MGQITINTPQGPALVDIEGDTISPEELERLRELAPPSEGETFDYTVISPSPSLEESLPSVAPQKTDQIVNEIENNSLRFQVARMDNDEEKAGLLTQLLGEGTFERDRDWETILLMTGLVI